MVKTYMQKSAEVKRGWHVLDAKGRVLGQLATEIAVKLMGKEKVTFTPHIDDGDYVIVINAAEIEVTGPKTGRKKYYDHSHFPGGITERSFGEMQTRRPGEVIERAVFNMIPKNKLRQDRMGRLKIYAGTEHPHASQVNK